LRTTLSQWRESDLTIDIPGVITLKSDAVFESFHSGHRCAGRAAVEGSGALNAVPDDLAATVRAHRCERMNGALERVERVCCAGHRHRERLVVAVAAYFALRHSILIT